eukprot:CAMPEP_0172590752 /NCGR_PEP_ID=MMETSP1068-20121228/9395_1 /TAXON_ID=35684 /ORGANISM="Pseudopedinella elastica, Strain CCMP716" /LENGTH=77 /DNA_ID=CAMNT_0013386829 /DNA_START=81 /DNA_END=314 /DNA_ORIENTATION=+
MPTPTSAPRQRAIPAADLEEDDWAKLAPSDDKELVSSIDEVFVENIMTDLRALVADLEEDAWMYDEKAPRLSTAPLM